MITTKWMLGLCMLVVGAGAANATPTRRPTEKQAAAAIKQVLPEYRLKLTPATVYRQRTSRSKWQPTPGYKFVAKVPTKLNLRTPLDGIVFRDYRGKVQVSVDFVGDDWGNFTPES